MALCTASNEPWPPLVRFRAVVEGKNLNRHTMQLLALWRPPSIGLDTTHFRRLQPTLLPGRTLVGSRKKHLRRLENKAVGPVEESMVKLKRKVDVRHVERDAMCAVPTSRDPNSTAVKFGTSVRQTVVQIPQRRYPMSHAGRGSAFAPEKRRP